MRLLLLTTFFIFILTPTNAQKIKFKKDIIEVDKEDKYEFIKTKKSGLLSSDPTHFTLKEVGGSDILVFTDTVFTYKKLPNETDIRSAYFTVLCSTPKFSKSAAIDKPSALNPRKYYISKLEELGFFKTNELTSDMYSEFIEGEDPQVIKDRNHHIDTTNENRLKNYTLTKEKYGELSERKPGRIMVEKGIVTDGQEKIGEIKLSKRGSYAHTYEIINNEGFTIATAAIILKEGKGNVRTLVDEKRKHFLYQRGTDGKGLTTDQKLWYFANHLVLQGYL